MDVPRHFCRDGDFLSRFFPDTVGSWYPAYCLDIEKSGDQGLRAADFAGAIEGRSDARALLIRTGSCRLRGENPDVYAACHPWVHEDVAGFLREACPDLQVFGIDTISIAVPSHRKEGHDSHRAFLCDDRPILLLEDADLSSEALLGGPFRLTIAPFLIDEIDGVPVTAFISV